MDDERRTRPDKEVRNLVTSKILTTRYRYCQDLVYLVQPGQMTQIPGSVFSM